MSCWGLNNFCNPCLPCLPQCIPPACVQGCPIVIQSGAIIPDPYCLNACNPYYGGISAPAKSCGKADCCGKVKHTKSKWYAPGTTNVNCDCGCGC
jgi:hypothetical protein